MAFWVIFLNMYLQTSNCDDLFLSLFKANFPWGNQIIFAINNYYYLFFEENFAQRNCNEDVSFKNGTV